MRVPRGAITSIFDADRSPLPAMRRILHEAGVEVVRPARKLPPAWRGFVKSKRFTRSRLWSRLRYDFLRDHAGRCQCCGRSAADGEKLNVDHVLTRKTHPQLALAYANLQLLCSTCNKGKGNRDKTDWRFARGVTPPTKPRASPPASRPRRRAPRRRKHAGITAPGKRTSGKANRPVPARRARYGRDHWGRRT